MSLQVDPTFPFVPGEAHMRSVYTAMRKVKAASCCALTPRLRRRRPTGGNTKSVALCAVVLEPLVRSSIPVLTHSAPTAQLRSETQAPREAFLAAFLMMARMHDGATP
jgi:hypothetical protein